MRQFKLSIRNGILFVFILILLASAAAKLPARAENASSMENAPLVHAKLKGPSNLKIKTKLKTATLSWDPDPSPYCSGYAIYLCKRSIVPPNLFNPPLGIYTRQSDGYYWYAYRQIGKTKNTTFTYKASVEKIYYLEVLSYNVDPTVYISKHREFKAFKAKSDLRAPTNVKAVQTGKKKVKLTWDAGQNAKSYRIYRSANNGNNYYLIGKTKTHAFTDMSVKAGKKYKYQIYSIKGKDKRISETVVAWPLEKPKKLWAIYMGDRTVSLEWKAVSGAAKYQIWQKGPNDSEFKKIMTTAKLQKTIDVTQSGVYQYYIVPMKKGFQALKSDTKSVTVTIEPAYRAVLIGQTYSGLGGNLAAPGCEKDRAGMEKMLKTLDRTEYSKILNVKNGTENEIFTAIDKVFREALKEDTTLLYFSGYGSTGGVLYDSGLTPISISSLRNRLDRYRGKIVIILDCGCSGAAIGKNGAAGNFTKAEAKQFNASVIQAFRGAAPKSSGDFAAEGYYVLTSCKGDEFPQRTHDFSDFTYGFLTGTGWELQEGYKLDTMYADSNGDKQITLQEAYEFTANFVENFSGGTGGTVQVFPANCTEIFFAR